MSCNGGKTDGGTIKLYRKIFFNKNYFDLNQRHMQVFQAFRFLKNKKETIGETQKV